MKEETYQVRNDFSLMETLQGAAGLLDHIKQEWGAEWSNYDQSVRDSITAHLKLESARAETTKGDQELAEEAAVANIGRLERKVAALREALEKIAEGKTCCSSATKNCKQIARAALSETKSREEKKPDLL